jgi:hypothetical protein
VVIERALAYDPTNRFVTALEMNLACEGAMVEIGEPTTAAVVAHYTGQLLTDRKAARRKAVESALTSARNRDANPPNDRGTSQGAMPIPTPGPSAPLVSTQNFTPGPPSAEPSSLPSQVSGGGSYGSMNGPMGYPEAPSAASQGTLGVASIEYPMPPPVDDRVRRKRYMSAAFLGVSLAAGVVGVVLIISTAVLKKDSNAQAQTVKSAAVANAPPAAETAADPTPSPSPPGSTGASPHGGATAAPTTSPSTPTPAATPTPTLVGQHTPPPTGTTTHKPAITPPPPAPPPVQYTSKPVTTTTTKPASTGKPDRGF